MKRLFAKYLASCQKPANLTAVAALLVAFLALITSVRGCQLAQDANQLSQRQYREDRLLVLQGSFSDDNHSLKLRSISEGNLLLEGRAYFPSKISSDEWAIYPSQNMLPLATVKMKLQEMIAIRFPHKPGYVQLSLNGKIPILIDAQYASRGERYRDQSLYLLAVEFVVGEDSLVPPDVKFTGLTFYERHDTKNLDVRKMLDDLFEPEKSINIPSRSP